LISTTTRINLPRLQTHRHQLFSTTLRFRSTLRPMSTTTASTETPNFAGMIAGRPGWVSLFEEQLKEDPSAKCEFPKTIPFQASNESKRQRRGRAADHHHHHHLHLLLGSISLPILHLLDLRQRPQSPLRRAPFPHPPLQPPPHIHGPSDEKVPRAGREPQRGTGLLDGKDGGSIPDLWQGRRPAQQIHPLRKICPGEDPQRNPPRKRLRSNPRILDSKAGRGVRKDERTPPSYLRPTSSGDAFGGFERGGEAGGLE
jgi:hypothetical protein